MLRRDTGKFSRTLGIAYIIFQAAGGFLGGLLSFLFNHKAKINFGIDDADKIGYSLFSEVLGAFFLSFLYLTQTEDKTKVSKDPGITTLIISASYIAALLMVSGPFNYLACLNPAVAFGAMMEQSYAK
jgi:glycerol uptake facilitator-like aquaporin